MEFYGHERTRELLERELPPVALLRGPESVGKWALAEYLVEYHGVVPIDVRMVTRLGLGEDSASDVRGVIQFVSVAPFGRLKVVVLRLDGASDKALNTLLKALEEPPEYARFILVSSARTLVTIESRAQLFTMGLLTQADVLSVLTERLAMNRFHAEPAAKQSRGTIKSALSVAKVDDAKSRVMSVLQGLADKDRAIIVQATKGTKIDGSPAWGSGEHELLREWAVEAVTGRWSVFTATEAPGLLRDKSLPKRLLMCLGQLPDAKPHLSVRTALEPMLR
jgi:DNA polymerase III, delta subunit